MSYNIDNLSFTIWGNGHDATLMDSGDGEVQVFSHPFVPLNSLMYAGQWYFLVPDENGEPFDAVKDDLAHCTFSPALGATFDTVGEIEVTCNYHREYISAEETIIVDKTVKQTIEVVDHGAITRAGGWNASKSCYCNSDVYADGYCFIRPRNTNTLNETYVTVWDDYTVKKLSSFPWRMTALGYGSNGTFKLSGLEDISELQYADTSNVTSINFLFGYITKVTDWTPISGWVMSKVTTIQYLVGYSSGVDFNQIGEWDVSNVTNMEYCLAYYGGTNFNGLEKWHPDKVRYMNQFASGCGYVQSLEPFYTWKIKGITSLHSSFASMKGIKNLHGLENFDVSLVTDLYETFYNCTALEDISALLAWTPKPTSMERFCRDDSALASYHGIENFDVSNCTNFSSAFHNTWNADDLEPFRGWDVSKGQNFNSMFGECHWFTTLEPIGDWVFDSMTTATAMFGSNSALTVIDVDWTLPDTADISNMFQSLAYYYLTNEDKYAYRTSTLYIDRQGNHYGGGTPATLITKDASGAENWTSGTGRNAFDSNWSNRPSWN